MEKQQTTIRLPVDLKNQIQREADCIGISFNAYVLILIDKGLKHLLTDDHAVFHSRQQIPRK